MSLVEHAGFAGGSAGYHHARVEAGTLGTRPCAHDHDESIFVHLGEVSVAAGGRDFTAGDGALVTVPAGSEHAVRVLSEWAVLEVFAPPGQAGCLAQAGPARPGEEVSL
jgi:mannose-6-phosphate isomerase-like protein (cupin superfamily)